MYRKDYFQKLAEQFARMLLKLSGLKEAGAKEQAVQVVQEAYKDFWGLDGSIIKSTKKENLPVALKEKFKFTDEQIEYIARLMYEEAMLIDEAETKQDLLSRSMLILDHLNATQKLYAFEREALMEKIRRGISEIS